MAQYQWKNGFPAPPVDADIFGSIIEKIQNKKDGASVTADDVVVEASNPDSPIRDAFQWDNEAAGHQWRLHQARRYIGALTVVRVNVETHEPISTRGFLKVDTDAAGSGYQPIERVMSDKEMRAQVLARAKRDLEQTLNRYKQVLQMGGYSVRISEVIEMIQSEIDSLATPQNKAGPRRHGHTEEVRPSLS